jgi:integrase
LAKGENTMSLFDDFLNTMIADGKASSAETYGFLWRPFAKWMSEHGRDAEKFTAEDVREYRAYRSVLSESNKKVLSDTSKNVFLVVVKRFAGWCKDKTTDMQERSRLEQIIGVGRIKPMKRIIRKALTLEELKLLIETAQDKDASRIYLLAYFGLRAGELATIHDVDYARGRLIAVGEKTKTERILYFNAECGRVLQLAVKNGWLKIKEGTFGRRLKQYNSQLVGIRLTPKTMRHTFNTFTRERIGDPILRVIMGHEERSMTDTYTTVFENKLKDAMVTKHYLDGYFVPSRIKELGG